MTRLALTLAVWMSVVSVVEATLSPRSEPRTARVPSPEVARLAAQLLSPAANRGATPEFVLTEQTEILLDGQPCKFEEIPAHARITHLEVAADNKTALKIHFRTRK